jgi:ribonuclease PH
MTGRGGIVEIQTTAERDVFTRGQLDEMLGLAEQGVAELSSIQRAALGL